MKKKNKISFSKIMEIQESILIWITTISLIVLAYICVFNQYFGELPWITAMIGFPWTAYGVSQACYYKKAEKENTKNGLKFESTMLEYQTEENLQDWAARAEEFFNEKAVG